MSQMDHSYRLYCRVAAVVFIVITIYVPTVHALRHQLAGDWFHSVLHLISALLGAYAGWKATGIFPAKMFTWSIGVLYLGLGIYGWFTPGILMNSPLAIPLSARDNIVHLLLSGPALAIGAHDLLTSPQSSATPAQR
jgi:uncharacterized membrane protein YfcA